METTDYLLVRAELERILSSRTFKQSYILSNFLRYVVIETIEDHSNEIKEYSIAVKALGKPDDFNPQLDAVVRIHAGRLRRSLHLYYSEEGSGNPMIISLQKGTYIPQFLLRDSSDNPRLVYHLEEPVVGNLMVHRVAVLPFSNLSPHPEDQFIVEGFCEQLSSDLASFRELAMISYFSTAKYRAEHSDIRVVGRELNASMVLTGSIYRDKKQLRVSIQLVSTDTGIQVWTKTYQREISNTYIYDAIDSIVKQVISKLTGYTGIIIKNIAAASPLDAAKQGDFLDPLSFYYHYLLQSTEDTFQCTRQQLEKTVKKNPDGALAWAILGQLYVDGCALGYVSVQNPIHEAIRLAQKALQLDPECQHAYMSMAWALIHLQDKQGAEEFIREGLALNTNSSFFLGTASFMFALMGEYDDCIQHFENSKQLNGAYPWWMNIGPILAHFYHGDYSRALQFANQINVPGVFWNGLFKIAALAQLDRMDDASRLANQYKSDFPGQADIGCVVLKKLLFHQEVYHRIKTGLVKAGIKVHDIPLISHKAS